MMTQHLRKLLLLIFVSISFGLLPISQAFSATLSAPQLPIDDSYTKLKERLKDKAFAEDFHQIAAFVEKVVDPYIDFNRVSALVLGKLWKKASNDEKLRFKKEFRILLMRTYSRAFFEFKDWSVKFVPLNVKEGAKKTIVKTKILQPGKPELDVNYRMVFTKGQWKSYDIMIEGVSLVTNYRTSIKNQYKKTGSLNAIIEQLAKKNNAALSK